MKDGKPFNVKGKGRHYKSPTTGQNYPSVTNIGECYPKQQALVHWSANRQKVFDVNAAYELYLSGGQFADADHYKRSLDIYIGKSRQHIIDKEKAGNIGSQLHDAVEADMKRILGEEHKDPPTLEGAAMWAYMAFQDWWAECDIKPLKSELFVWSDEHEYAGTTDLLAEVKLAEALLKKVAPKYRSTNLISYLGETVLALVDFKTAKGIYPDMWAQIAAYIVALRENGDMRAIDTTKGRPIWGMIVRLPKTEDDPEFEIRLMPPDLLWDKFGVFLAEQAIWKDKHYGTL